MLLNSVYWVVMQVFETWSDCFLCDISVELPLGDTHPQHSQQRSTPMSMERWLCTRCLLGLVISLEKRQM